MKIFTFPEKVTEELAEETGWHIGDGSMNYYSHWGKERGFYQLRGHIEDDRAHYLWRIKLLFKKLYGVDISLREMPSTRVFGFQIWSDDLVAFKSKLGLPLGPKLTISIPYRFLTSDNFKIAVIRGIFDTDGCVYLERKNGKLYPRLEIKTISFPLGEQLKKIYLELGLRATLYIEHLSHPGNRKTTYGIVIRGEEMFHQFMKIIVPANLKHIAKYLRFQQSKSF